MIITILCHRSHFGEEVVGVEQGKKENRSEYGFYLTMKEFLDVRLGYYPMRMRKGVK